MRVQVKLFATLRRYIPDPAAGSRFEVDLADGATIADLVNYLKVPSEVVRVTFVNGRARPADWRLQPGDDIAIFPPIGGG